MALKTWMPRPLLTGLLRQLSLLRLLSMLMWMLILPSSYAAVTEFNTAGGTTATNGLHFYIEDTSHIQVRRLNNTGQVYSPTVVPPSVSLDNGVFLLANTKLYGPSHTVATFNPTGGMYNTFSITAANPGNPSAAGVQQIATNNLGITNGPQITIAWKYTTPLDFMTADVTVTIPAGYAVSAANPVRYYHVFDTYLGGSDNGCGVKFTDSNGKVVVGTYPPSSGTACPSSTAIPAGVSIVESFRERSGRTFSNYCAAGWSTFFTNGGVNCSVLQTAPLSNTIATTYQDTGIGVEFDFTATGTYTFSYDFVIGSTLVPAYDHIELQHDGSGTLCPETVKVLACTSSTVPCPALSVVNTGTITGNLTVSPSSPAVTITPATFSVGSAGSTANVQLQAAAPGGSFTLASSGISGTPPLNGTKCWNTTTGTASCNLVFANTPCLLNFECIETSVTPYANLTASPSSRNPLYTKLANAAFGFDVVAIGPGGVQATAYTGNNIAVELFDDTPSPAPACSAYSAPVTPAQTINFVVGDGGRKSVTFPVLNKAYRKLRCRATDSSRVPIVNGCSSDTFTVRPAAFSSVSTTTANADSVNGFSTINAPIIKAGASFDLIANTATIGYDDLPKINTLKAEWPNFPQPTSGGRVAPGVGSVTGFFSVAANASNGNGASGSTFKYDDIGYFRLTAQGIYDDSFVTYSNDMLNGDCINVSPNDFSNVLIGAKYGCKFGNATTTPYFGRFVPDHFAVAAQTFTNACSAGGFTYMNQPFTLNATIEARNVSNGITLNYQTTVANNFAKATVSPQIENNNSGIPISLARLSSSGTAWGNAGYGLSATTFTRLATPDGPYDNLQFGVSVVDESGAVVLTDRDMDAATTSCTADSLGLSNGNCAAKLLGTTKMRFGRVKLDNAQGSELLNLPIPLRLQYWAGTGWMPNTLDSCTVIAPSNFSFVFPAGTAAKPNNLAACETAISVAGSAPNQKLDLRAPGVGNNGWTDLTLNLSGSAGNQCVAVGGAGAPASNANLPWLQFNWLGTGSSNPKAKATFGVYKNANEFIYIRELY